MDAQAAERRPEDVLRLARRSAKQIEIPVEQYLSRRLAGQEWCSACREWHLRAVFPVYKGRRISACRLGASRRWPGKRALMRAAREVRFGHALLSAAGRLGIPPEEYEQHLAAGEAHCSGCNDWHPKEAFWSDPRSSHGVARYCGPFLRRRRARERGHTGICREDRWDCVTLWGPQDHRHCVCGGPMVVADNVERCGRCEAKALRWGWAAAA